METRLTIRSASLADGFLIHELTQAIWSGRVSPESTVFRETPETVTMQIAKGGAVILEDAGEAIGAGRFVFVPPPISGETRWIEIKRIGVLPGRQKAGLGRMILSSLEAAGRGEGAAGAQLAVRTDQPRLVDYYLDCGYELAGDVKLTTPNPRSPEPTGMRKWFDRA